MKEKELSNESENKLNNIEEVSEHILNAYKIAEELVNQKLEKIIKERKKEPK